MEGAIDNFLQSTWKWNVEDIVAVQAQHSNAVVCCAGAVTIADRNFKYACKTGNCNNATVTLRSLQC